MNGYVKGYTRRPELTAAGTPINDGTRQVSINVSNGDMAKLSALAARDGMSISATVRRLLRDRIAGEGA